MRVGLILGTYQGKFQIPNNPGQTPSFSLTGVSDVDTGFNARPSSELDQRQREVNHYVVASFQQTRGALDYQASLFYQYDNGNQTSSDPETIIDNSEKRGNLSSVYVQDEWRIDPSLTVNYGGRFDHVAAFTNEHQFSPRLNTLWKMTDATALHAGYARYFTPPPQELVLQESIDKFIGTTNQPEITASDTVKAERTHYFDVGLTHTFSPGLTAGVDGYYKRIKNLLDEGQFGQALILTPFNYADGYAEGIEFSTTHSDPI